MTELASQADQRSGDGQSVVGQAQQKVQEKAGEMRGQVSNVVREQVDTRSTQAGEQVSSVADALRRTSQSLREEGNEAPAKVTERVAEQAERFGTYLRDSDADQILSGVESLARRRPWAFAAGGLVVGMIASRFLKASSGGRYQGRNGSVGSQASYASQTPTEPEIVFEPDVELDTRTGVRHGA